MTKIIPFSWCSRRFSRVSCQLLSVSVFWAINVYWWSGDQQALYAQKVNHAVSAKQGHKAGLKADSLVGRKLFESSCAGCHGLDGRGGEKGPNIATRPEISRRSDGEILALLQHGVPDAGMPAFGRLGDVKLKAVVRHLRTLQGLNLKTLVAGGANEGKKLFHKEGGCASCHMINGEGGFLGSDLSKYGAFTSVAEMREQITNHDQSPRARTMIVSTRDGRTLTGFARNEDNFSLQLQTLDGEFHFLDKTTVVSVDHSTAVAATAAEKKLTKSELDAILSYLVRVAESSQDGVKWETMRKHHEEDEE
ncbi:MAG: cytochrome c oxidase cbb3-type subunit [Acidobacteriaceae bacterium]|nr:cytochrome c oxidase cbb3-type subunit [Acidobacteriaceae bacterium]